MVSRIHRRLLASCMCLACVLPLSVIGGWATYRGNGARSGYTAEALAQNLSADWVYRAPPPCPAWPSVDSRATFDRAYHVAVAEGGVFFGSSATGVALALDLATGQERWSFVTGGPIRLAPAVADGRVYVASDDGFLYCLSAAAQGKADGAGRPTLHWSVRGGPTESLVLGNDRVISRWPLRGGPVVHQGTVYFGAGIWPSEGVYVHALDALTGKRRWRNGESGSLRMPQPHPGAFAASGVSARGYLAVDDERLFVPSGRSVPAALERATGKLLYFHLGERVNVKTGGTDILVGAEHFLNGGAAFDSKTGKRLAALPKSVRPELAAQTASETVWWSAGHVRVGRWGVTEGKDRKGAPIQKRGLTETASFPVPYGGMALIRAAGEVVSAGTGAGGAGIAVLDIATGKVRFSAPIKGNPLGLAVAAERLLVSTDRGTIHCFSGVAGKEPRAIVATAEPVPPVDHQTVAAVGEMLRAGAPRKGWAVDLGCGTGVLACELARRTELMICAVDPDPEKVAVARQRLRQAGLLGTRVSVHHAPLDGRQLPPYFADLVVSGRSVAGNADAVTKADVVRLQHPFVGRAWLGRPGAMVSLPPPGLPGSGEWTHQYADAGNTNCSADTLVHGPLGALWFKDFGFTMPSRHGRGPAPLFMRGRLIVEGRDAIRCIDAYNGRVLWEYALPGILKANDQDHIMGVSGTGSNICLDRTSVYIRREHDCLCLDLDTGALRRTIPAPAHSPDGEPGTWGYLACVDGTLFGTLADRAHLVEFRYIRGDMSTQFTESTVLFAMDAQTGEEKWRYVPKHSIRHNALAIGDGRVHLIDRAQAAFDRLDPAYKGRSGRRDVKPFPHGTLVALNAKTGRELWRNAESIWGTTLALSTEHKVLVMAYQNASFQLRSELGGRLAAFGAADGKRIWDVEARYKSRLALSGRTIYAQPGDWDLLTGKRGTFTFSRAYGCGTVAASRTMLLFRSGTIGFVDLTSNYGTENYGGARPGCWINAIPAGGLALVPDATARCTCSYLLKSSLALIPYGVRAPRLNPATAAVAKPLQVTIAAEADSDGIHYTLDGSDPTQEDALYTGPITVNSTAILKSRAFRSGMPPSPLTEGRFIIDPTMVPISGGDWAVHDAPGKPGASLWKVANGTVTETSNYYIGDAKESDPHVERPGTCRIYTPGGEWGDGELNVELASSDNDGLGVVLRWQAPDRYLLWAMDAQRNFHVLACKNGDTYQILDVAKAGYTANAWSRVKVVLEGDTVAVSINGKPDLSAKGVSLRKGTFGLYSWGSSGSKFRGASWRPAGQ
ncbi:MAG: PQQ-binding-like beta-propeller repeat protein [Victivallales bacterium]|nr:PQQ-binding-like beta-propeller repeat protein [Victivallales bacterium]